MMTRREGLFLAGALSVGAHARAGNAATAMAPTVQTPVAFTPPPGSCDCHTHVFPDPARFESGMGTDFLERIAELASAALSRLRPR